MTPLIWIHYFPKSSANIVHTTLNEFVEDVGIPDTLINNFATEQTGKHSDVIKLIHQLHIKLLQAEKVMGQLSITSWSPKSEILKPNGRHGCVTQRFLLDFGIRALYSYIAEVQPCCTCPGSRPVS